MTRLVVYRPIDPALFNGTVFVEWLNVSGGLDGSPDWMFIHRHVLRTGAAWVGVSAQKAGIDGGGLIAGNHLKLADRNRYGDLLHPGDAFAYDIFTRAGEVVRSRAGRGVLASSEADLVLAIGSSQSAMALVTYINAVDRRPGMFDGYLVHGRGAEGMSLAGGFASSAGRADHGGREGSPVVTSPVRGRHLIRSDARVPVLTVQSETDVVVLGGGRARQPDSGNT